MQEPDCVRTCEYVRIIYACMHAYIHDFLTEPNVYLATYLLCLSITPDVSADFFFPGKSGTQMFIYLSTRFSRLSINKAI